MPLIWGVVIVAGLFGAGYAADEIGDAADQSANLAKWAAALMALYLVFQVMRAGGRVK